MNFRADSKRIFLRYAIPRIPPTKFEADACLDRDKGNVEVNQTCFGSQECDCFLRKSGAAADRTREKRIHNSWYEFHERGNEEYAFFFPLVFVRNYDRKGKKKIPKDRSNWTTSSFIDVSFESKLGKKYSISEILLIIQIIIDFR